ncbi:hypothetical protein F511_23404 [Dorcoceras hygrometricum]|uniref:Uncharacterized protein n=1 Tax=Dorcoceras hygrometricum TaxID=472368 RepID=A0A2Z7BJH3_9LAMI|nr:hypothetical protein F511_23404 [Dorcoceras hygrometricum]
MASALISNSFHISFDSVLAMDDAGLVAVFEALVATGLKDFMGCHAIYYEAALTEFFENSSVRDRMVFSTIRGMTVEISENVFAGAFQLPMDGLTDLSEVPKDLVFDARSIVSNSGEQVSTSCKKREMKIEFHLLSDILAKTIFLKAVSFDAVTHERFLLMTTIISDEVDKLFNSFVLKKLVTQQTDDISAKEELVLSWAEADSTRVALNKKMYILTKYRELLIRKFFEAHRANFVPGDGSSAVDLKILDKLSSLHLFLVEELKMEVQAHGLNWDRSVALRFLKVVRVIEIPQRIVNNEILRQRSYDDTLPPLSKFFQLMKKRCADITLPNSMSPICTAFARFCLFNGLSTVDIRNFVSSIAEDRSALRVVQSVNRSVFVSQPIQFIASSAVEDQHVQMLLDQRPFSSSSSDDSSMHFDDTDAAVTSLFLPTVATDVQDAFVQLRASIDQLHFEQIRRKDDVDKLRYSLLMHIRDIEKKFTE